MKQSLPSAEIPFAPQSDVVLCRSNAFRVKDIEAFRAWVSKFETLGLVEDEASGQVSIYAKTPDGWPAVEGEDESYVYPVNELGEYVADGSAAILMEMDIGASMSSLSAKGSIITATMTKHMDLQHALQLFAAPYITANGLDFSA